jgi:hypothetical protein
MDSLVIAVGRHRILALVIVLIVLFVIVPTIMVSLASPVVVR